MIPHPYLLNIWIFDEIYAEPFIFDEYNKFYQGSVSSIFSTPPVYTGRDNFILDIVRITLKIEVFDDLYIVCFKEKTLVIDIEP